MSEDEDSAQVRNLGNLFGNILGYFSGVQGCFSYLAILGGPGKHVLRPPPVPAAGGANPGQVKNLLELFLEFFGNFDFFFFPNFFLIFF